MEYIISRFYLSTIRFISRPRWFFYFMIIPIGFLAAAYVQTIQYQKTFQLVLDQSTIDYSSYVIGHPDFVPTSLLVTAIFFIPYLLLHLLNGIGEIKQQTIRQTLRYFARHKLREWWKHIVGISCVILLVVLYEQPSNFQLPFLEELKYSILLLMFILFIRLLTRKFKAEGEIGSIASTAIVVLASLVVSTATALITKRFLIPLQLHPIISQGLWQNLILILVIYVLLMSYGVWIGTRFSCVDAPKDIPSRRQYSLPVIFSLIFVFLALAIVLIEFNHTGSLLFEDRMRELFPSNKLNMGKLRSYYDNHIWWRSVYCLLLGVVFSTVASSLIKVGAYRSMAVKNYDRKSDSSRVIKRAHNA